MKSTQSNLRHNFQPEMCLHLRESFAIGSEFKISENQVWATFVQ